MGLVGTYMTMALALYLGVARASVPTPQGNGCTFFTKEHTTCTTTNSCFCYKPKWSIDVVWPVFQIHIQSNTSISVVPPTNCTEPEDMYAYISCWWHSVWTPRDSKDVLINVNQLDKDFCFYLSASSTPAKLIITASKMWFNLQIVAVLSGIMLFCLADKLSRSTIFFYATGVMLGMTASVLFLLIVLKRFISKPSTFWMLISTCCFLTAYVMQFLNANIIWIWTEKKPYVIGYFAILGLLSFAACYSHGPLRSEFSFNLFTWMLQIIACLLIYFGHPVHEIALALIAVLLTFNSLSYLYRAIRFIYRKVRHKKPVVRFLTEEEYQEQCEVETLKALQELRHFCSSPDLNLWLTVSRLSSPKRFAEFVLGSSHVSIEEVTAHDQQYGLGSLFLEDLDQDRELQNNLQVAEGQNENPYIGFGWQIETGGEEVRSVFSCSN